MAQTPVLFEEKKKNKSLATLMLWNKILRLALNICQLVGRKLFFPVKIILNLSWCFPFHLISLNYVSHFFPSRVREINYILEAASQLC